ncbi:hypothetical protein LF817_09040 [Halobacillus sp. A1]|uniref:hypothetical protein n=1 Tax=Halobacillus sp. A1 TaxID=2880262 RepID=UPI0020A6D244|nr:hypothetical protein [Halobacillus sp. A1]MCP3031492.1 hypothetical protein [Halobacillus sp. A1]
MLIIAAFSFITIFSVIFALRKKRPILLTLPVLSLLSFAFIKILMVPMPFWDTIKFIFDLRG